MKTKIILAIAVMTGLTGIVHAQTTRPTSGPATQPAASRPAPLTEDQADVRQAASNVLDMQLSAMKYIAAKDNKSLSGITAPAIERLWLDMPTLKNNAPCAGAKRLIYNVMASVSSASGAITAYKMWYEKGSKRERKELDERLTSSVKAVETSFTALRSYVKETATRPAE